MLQALDGYARELLPTMRQLLAALARSRSQESGLVDLARLAWQWTGDPGEALPTVRELLTRGLARAGSRSGSQVGASAALAADLGDPALIPLLRELNGAAKTPEPPVALALWRLTGDTDGLAEMLVPAVTGVPPSPSWPKVLDLLAELGPAAGPALPALQDVASRDRSPFVDAGMDSPYARGVGHKHDRFLAAVRDTIAAIDPLK